MIVWKSASVSPRLASFRYRVALPGIYLEGRGIRSRFAWHPRLTSLRGAEAIVFSKTFRAGDLALARRAYSLEIPIVCDLCDNVFVEGYYPHARVIFPQIASLASVIVTTTAPLAEVVAAQIGNAKAIQVIPDPLERPQDVRAIVKRFRLASTIQSLLRKANSVRGRVKRGAVAAAKSALAKLGKWGYELPANSPARPADRVSAPTLFDARQSTVQPGLDGSVTKVRTITWFGNHGGDYADFGMLDILIAAQALERIAARRPIKLRVISNNRAKFQERIASLRLPTEYFEWTPDSVHSLVEDSDVVILPITLNEFTRCKSANRLLFALNCGVPVVTTHTPASAEFDGCVLFEDWERNVETYFDDHERRQAHLRAGSALIAGRFAPEAVATKWALAIETAKRMHAAAGRPMRSARRLVLLVNLVQDLELILPIYRKMISRSAWQTEVWVTTHDLLSRAEMWKRLAVAGIPYHVVEVRYARSGGLPEWDGVAALLSASESTADPHWHARQIVRIARQHGVRTYTMQHGFQNVGLTYGDERFPVKDIRFASDVVFLWGTLESLHPDVATETRAKCVSIGCPKPLEGGRGSFPISYSEPVVAVFENLHSARYDDEYRKLFLENLVAVMKSRPDLRFLIKPHPAGQFLTARYGGKIELPANAVVADPRAQDWVNVSASDILDQAAAVITTVTTVAFDAARAAKRVAVVGAGYKRDLSTFRPLTVLQRVEDWDEFIRRAVDRMDPELEVLSRDFSNKAVVPGDAAERMLSIIQADMERAMSTKGPEN